MAEAADSGAQNASCEASKVSVRCTLLTGVDSPRVYTIGTLTHGLPLLMRRPLVLAATCEAGGAAKIVSTYERVATQPVESVAASTTGKVSATAGVPCSCPVAASSVSPPGKEPDATDHV